MRKIYQALQVFFLFCLLSALSLSAAYAQVDVTFRVNMEGQDVSNGVWMTGELNAWEFTALTQEGETDVYSVTLSLESGMQYIYYYRLTNDWAGPREEVPAECANSIDRVGTEAPWEGDRLVIVPAESTTLDVVYYSGCAVDGVTTSVVNPKADEATGISIRAYNDQVQVTIQADLLSGNSAVVDVMDVNGRVLNSLETRETVTSLSSPGKGIYFVRVRVGDWIAVEKIILL
ncbi:T9SS type A sorting domain-containing protein [Geofilum rubicundum]|uniref:Arabinogalactan endo-1,4-beta-galactosidase n=1 Tax=Geofilum rubicundum JCM 15548 TaxID=1236989 RepID=A0A0E9LUS0_9BACT|nr:T9SS type A sorting domain-containing protein [Geofilum rubicundum]GAO28610.1 arabinogalactan endo-1,4-beta-galactosidase precursor [Geofilum rubicundum JCM 15548]